ncbi:MAG TPA: class I SAM-dependent methyltransferase [Terriglobales bacterium]|nr:class I SAM-dependent methyltransferase [Terriglobales bacterium]
MATMMLSNPTAATAVARPCRFCGAALEQTFLDLGMSPLCETYPSAAELNRGEVYYPLHVYVCGQCFLVQLEEYEKAENIFGHYPYFSSYSDSWLEHAETYCYRMKERFGLNPDSFVVEVASNDGYLLQYFVRQGVPVLGVEPAANVAKVAEDKGIPTLVRFFGSRVARELASQERRADLVVGNNVLAQVPDLNDFVEGLHLLLKPEGVLTLEFPHLLRLMQHNEFDTIYHEHFSYFSMLTTVRILERQGLKAFDVEELASHGGSLRVYACRREAKSHVVDPRLGRLLAEEDKAGLACLRGYENFALQVRQTKLALLEFLLNAAREGKKVAGYGAPGKSATLLHFCGIGKDLIEYTVDRSPYKQGRFLPGTHIPIHHPDRIRETRPDYVIILPWNLKDEIMQQLQFIRQWGGHFVVPIPRVTVY